MKLQCPECDQRLRLPDEQRGRTVRCPKCNAIFSVAGPVGDDEGALKADPSQPCPGPPATGQVERRSSREPAISRSSAEPSWELKIADGRVFGPADRSTLDQWVREGRVGIDCWLRRPTDREWQPAQSVFPYLRTMGSPFGEKGGSSRVPPPVDATSSSGPVYTERHRGISIFVLSCFGFCCQITAVIAIVMAMNDLPKMKRGTMDPRGEYLTTTGLVLAVVSLILTFTMIGFSPENFFSFRWINGVSPI
ncbi:MAG: zinc-ribbon domain-containing protein [Planctomycetota bacterium]|nr:zinc-ribbon domain-containing protein [Planctomycetota bacterium]